MMPASVVSFPPFRLDLLSQRIWRNDEELNLRRRPFAVAGSF